MMQSMKLPIFLSILLLSSACASKLRGVGSKGKDQRHLKTSTNKGGELCTYDPLLNPQPEPCAPNHASVFDFKECDWVCKQLGEETTTTGSSIVEATRPTPEMPLSRQAVTPAAATRKGGKGGNCPSSAFTVMPAEPCPAGQSVMFSFRECTWVCKMTAPSTSAPQAKASLRAAAPAARKGGSSLCTYDPAANPMPESCPPNQAAGFDFKSCAWVCKVLSDSQTTTTARTTETTQGKGAPAGASSPARKGGSSLCTYDPAVNPLPESCTSNEAAVFDFKACAWVCKVMPETSNAVQQQLASEVSPVAQSRTFALSAAAASASSKKLCTYDPANSPAPEPCATANEAAVFDFKACEWVCKVLPETVTPPTVVSPESLPEERQDSNEEKDEDVECPPAHIAVLNKATGSYECIVPQIECPSGQHALYDASQHIFYCS